MAMHRGGKQHGGEIIKLATVLQHIQTFPSPDSTSLPPSSSTSTSCMAVFLSRSCSSPPVSPGSSPSSMASNSSSLCPCFRSRLSLDASLPDTTSLPPSSETATSSITVFFSRTGSLSPASATTCRTPLLSDPLEGTSLPPSSSTATSSILVFRSLCTSWFL